MANFILPLFSSFRIPLCFTLSFHIPMKPFKPFGDNTIARVSSHFPVTTSRKFLLFKTCLSYPSPNLTLFIKPISFPSSPLFYAFNSVLYPLLAFSVLSHSFFCSDLFSFILSPRHSVYTANILTCFSLVLRPFFCSILCCPFPLCLSSFCFCCNPFIVLLTSSFF